MDLHPRRLSLPAPYRHARDRARGADRDAARDAAEETGVRRGRVQPGLSAEERTRRGLDASETADPAAEREVRLINQAERRRAAARQTLRLLNDIDPWAPVSPETLAVWTRTLLATTRERSSLIPDGLWVTIRDTWPLLGDRRG